VSEVRHSNRLADLNAGFKDKVAADKAAGNRQRKTSICLSLLRLWIALLHLLLNFPSVQFRPLVYSNARSLLVRCLMRNSWLNVANDDGLLELWRYGFPLPFCHFILCYSLQSI
jgi:hypothetical protein